MSDSRPATYEHIDQVRALMTLCIHELLERARVHDASKLRPPELEAFDVISERLHGCSYGSDEYRATLREFKPALDHHVTQNRHHPEAHQDGIHGMTLLDLLEMTCDWIAASRRHADGDAYRSIRKVNMERFDFGDELASLLERSVAEILELEAAS